MGKKYYAVRKGKKPGIYNSWKECEEEVRGYSGAEYKKFTNYKEAEKFMGRKERKRKIDEEKLKDNEVIAYVDGSFDLDSFTYSYGVVFITNQAKETFNGRRNDREMAEMRNVAGELKGAMVAMEIAVERKLDILYLHYDYTGIEQWAVGNWKTNKEGTRSYKKYYDSIKDKLQVVFVKVKAHAGIKYNEEADQLAKDAL